MVNMGTNASERTLDESHRTGMAVIPVKVRARNSDQRVITYAFLDNGSNSSFCTESLMKQLGISGRQVKISLSTLVRDLLVSDLDENEWVSLPTLYTRLEIPVCSSDIPTQEDVDHSFIIRFLYLRYF